MSLVVASTPVPAAVSNSTIPDPYTPPDGTFNITGALSASTTVTAGTNFVATNGTITATANNATTNDITNLITINHNTSGTQANGIGTGILFGAESNTGISASAVQIAGIFTDIEEDLEISAFVVKTRLVGSALTEAFRVRSTGITVTQAAQVTGVAGDNALLVTGAAHLLMQASTEVNDVYFNLAQSKEWSAGALANQRAVRITAPTYVFVGASTVQSAATVSISGPPTAGANATLALRAALQIETGFQVFYNSGLGTADKEYMLFGWAANDFYINSAKSGTGSNRGIYVITGDGSGLYVSPFANVSIAGSSGGYATFQALSNTVGLSILGKRTTGTTASISLGNSPSQDAFSATSGTQIHVASTATINQSSTAGFILTHLTLTETTVGLGERYMISAWANTTTPTVSDRVFSVTSRGYLQVNQRVIDSATATPIMVLTGAAHTALTASTEFGHVSIDMGQTVQFATGAITSNRAIWLVAPTYAFVGASTITNAATFYIDNAPVAGTNATITNRYAMWIDAGKCRFDGDGTHVFELPADATDPTGGGGAATGRIPVLIGGSLRYLAYY